jgi:Flp pilus assembly pilin Flp
MKLFKLFQNFKNDEDGAVTVDWVVLTAALVGLGLLVIATIQPGLESAADGINQGLLDAGDRAGT